LLAAQLGELDLVALVIDGVHFGEHLCVVALGIGIDGGKALRAAVLRVFDHPVIGRCQLHKIINVADKLPGRDTHRATRRA
jgi:transposase-like protein